MTNADDAILSRDRRAGRDAALESSAVSPASRGRGRSGLDCTPHVAAIFPYATAAESTSSLARAEALVLWPCVPSWAIGRPSLSERTSRKVGLGGSGIRSHCERLTDPLLDHVRGGCDAQPLRARPWRQGLQADCAGDQVAGWGERKSASRLARAAQLVDRMLLAQAGVPQQGSRFWQGARLRREVGDFFQFNGTKLRQIPFPSWSSNSR